MGESRYEEARKAGFRQGLSKGLSQGFEQGLEEGLMRARDEFWCGFVLALSSWPLAGIAYLAWRAFVSP